MSKASEKVGAVLGLAQQAKAAKTPADWSAVVDRLRQERDREEAKFTETDQRRDPILLSGEDPVAYHRELHDAMERLRTIERNLAEAQREQEAADIRQARDQLEEQARTVREVSVLGYRNATREAHDLKQQLLAKLQEADTHLDVIIGFDETAKMFDRPDLCIGGAALRERLGQEMRGVHDEERIAPEPLPEKKGHPQHRQISENGQIKVVQSFTPYGHVNPSLTDINRSAMKDWSDRREDAMKVINPKLIEALQREANTLSPIERARGERTIVQQHFVEKLTGKAILKDQAIDGVAMPQRDGFAEQKRHNLHQALVRETSAQLDRQGM